MGISTQRRSRELQAKKEAKKEVKQEVKRPKKTKVK